MTTDTPLTPWTPEQIRALMRSSRWYDRNHEELTIGHEIQWRDLAGESIAQVAVTLDRTPRQVIAGLKAVGLILEGVPA